MGLDEGAFIPQASLQSETFETLMERIAGSPGDFLVVEPHFGLGNRLRVLSGALALQQKHGRELLLVWPIDDHFSASFQTLFQPPLPFHVFNGEFPNLQGLPSKVYDCMDLTRNNAKHQRIDIDPWDGMVVVIKSAYPLANPSADFKHSFMR